MNRLRESAADLILGTTCVGCDAPGRTICSPCLLSIRPRPRVCWPHPTPPALERPTPVAPVAAGAYDGVLRAAILAFKERGRYRLLPVLADLLCASLAVVAEPGSAVLLVPVPSRRAAVRERGYDAVALMARHAARRMRRRGVDVRMASAVVHRTVVRDQAGLSADSRQRNLEGALRVRSPVPSRRRVVIVDDVITTGSSVAEMVTTLRASGAVPVAIGVVAATRKVHETNYW